MTNPNQLVVLECDWMTQDDCLLRSNPIFVTELDDVSGWLHLASGDRVCQICYDAFKRVEKEWK